ncbi:MAG TPA: hypothetical protein VFX49_14565 [Chloroflexota bacterium]|nr:hypothetical protein [Chloroflexota bacterium]
MSQGWGTAPKKSKPKPPKRPLDPKALKAGHQGIAWLHVSGVAIWSLVALVFGGLMLAGRNVPGVLVIAAVGADLAHAAFLAVHVYLARAAARAAQRKLSATAAGGQPE